MLYVLQVCTVVLVGGWLASVSRPGDSPLAAGFLALVAAYLVTVVYTRLFRWKRTRWQPISTTPPGRPPRAPVGAPAPPRGHRWSPRRWLADALRKEPPAW